LGEEVLREKLGAFGDTRYALRRMDVHLDGPCAIPPSELKRLRRGIVALLEAQALPRVQHAIESVELARIAPVLESRDPPAAPLLVPLCRTLDQVEAVLALGFREVYLDFMELVGLGE